MLIQPTYYPTEEENIRKIKISFRKRFYSPRSPPDENSGYTQPVVQVQVEGEMEEILPPFKVTFQDVIEKKLAGKRDKAGDDTVNPPARYAFVSLPSIF